MTNLELTESGMFQTVNAGTDSKEITGIFCCDLLSIAMGKAKEGSVWVTIMGNINTIAVGALTDVSCIILAEGVNLDDNAIEKAMESDITILRTEEPIFETALKVHQWLEQA
jgi:hypothetical protein